jgi:type II secretory pathway pseudopilin PulG
MSARNLLTQRSKAPGARNTLPGFTLIEMVGILAVLAILATVLFSTMAPSLDLAAAGLERTNLVNYATALQNNILRNRYIPGAGDWHSVIAEELGVNVWSVTNNSRNIRRYFLIDPAMQIGTNTTGGLPYTQNSLFLAGASGQINRPVNPRVMLVTSLSLSASRQFPSFVTGASQVTINQFNNLWDWTDQSHDAPSDWLPAWKDFGADLIVQRINLAPLFVHLTLQNYPPQPSTIQAQYAIDRLATNLVPPMSPNNGVNAYLLKNTVLSLFQDSGAGGTLQADQMLSRDASFYYLQQVWRGALEYGTNVEQSTLQAAAGSAFLATAQAFAASRYNVNAIGGTTPPMVVNTMSNFMRAYNAYADAGFPSGQYKIAAKVSQNDMQTAMTHLVNNPAP